MRVPRGLQELNVKLSRLVEELTVQLGRSPTIPELAKAAGRRGGAGARGARVRPRVQLAVALLRPGGGDDEDELDPLETIGTEEPDYRVSEDWAVLEPGLRVLDERERMILHLRFFDGLTQSQIAQQVGISQMHVSRLIRRALEKIREEIAVDEPPRRAATSTARVDGSDRRLTIVREFGRPRRALAVLLRALPYNGQPMRTTAELREGFLSFFEEKGHLRGPSASLIPRADDHSTLFIERRDAAADAVLPRQRAAARRR